MDDIDKSKCDVVINHRLGCQIAYFLLGLFVIAMAVVAFVYGRDGNWKTYLVIPILFFVGAFFVYQVVMTIVKERVNKVPAMIITHRSIILSRKKDEINEIPFSIIESFGLWRKRHGKSSTTYLTIQYKKDAPVDPNEKFDRVEQIDTGGLNMMNYKLRNLLNERLQAYNERQM